jgi:hypothetical protein
MVNKSKKSRKLKVSNPGMPSSRKGKIISSKSLENLIANTLNSRKDLTKSETNLPARLLAMNMSNRKPTFPIQQNYSKSISSTYSSTMHNGEVHSVGKKIVNDSTKPFVQVEEMHNGQVDHYMIPRKQISNSSNSSVLNSKTSKTSKRKQHTKRRLQTKHKIKQNTKSSKSSKSSKTSKSAKSSKTY